MGIDKNRRIVIKPRGAIKTNGLVCNLKILSIINLTINIPNVMQSANKIVSEFNTSARSIKKPKSKKNNARIRKANSAVISLNLCTSLVKFSG